MAAIGLAFSLLEMFLIDSKNPGEYNASSGWRWPAAKAIEAVFGIVSRKFGFATLKAVDLRGGLAGVLADMSAHETAHALL